MESNLLNDLNWAPYLEEQGWRTNIRRWAPPWVLAESTKELVIYSICWNKSFMTYTPWSVENAKMTHDQCELPYRLYPGEI